MTDFLIVIGSRKTYRKRDNAYDLISLRKCVGSIYDIFSFGENMCVVCKKTSFRVFGGYCNKCINYCNYLMFYHDISDVIGALDSDYWCYIETIQQDYIFDDTGIDNFSSKLLTTIKQRVFNDILSSAAQNISFILLNSILYAFLHFDEAWIIPLELDYIFDFDIKKDVRYAMSDHISSCFEIILDVYVNGVTFSSIIYVLSSSGQNHRKSNKVNNKNSIIFSDKSHNLSKGCVRGLFRRFRSFIFDDIVKKISGHDFKDCEMKKYNRMLNEFLHEKYSLLHQESIVFRSKALRFNDIMHVFDGYGKIWGPVYFSFFDLSERTFFNIFVRLDIFIEKYFSLRRRQCSECGKRIEIHLFGRCLECLMDDFYEYTALIEKEYSAIRLLVIDARHDIRFVEVLDKVSKKIRAYVRHDNSEISSYMRAAFLRTHIRVIKDIDDAYRNGYNFSSKICITYYTWNEIFSLMMLESSYFKDRGILIMREKRISVNVKRYDFLCVLNDKSFLIEIDDASHYMKSAIENDTEKDHIAKQMNIRLIRIDVADICLRRASYAEVTEKFSKLCKHIDIFLSEF